MEDFAADIPADIARAAHRGTSFVPEDRGRQEQEGYQQTLAADLAMLSELATTDDKRAILDQEFPRYRAGYRARTIAHLAARSRVMSTMITGPSNFPTRRNAKRAATEDRRREELIEYRTRALRAIRRKLTPEQAPIMAGDSDAVSRLRADLADREATQARMTAANAAIRKHKRAGADAQVAALVALGIHAKIARALLEPDDFGRIGYADYLTRNNGARIRDIAKRIAGLESAKATPDQTIECENARLEVSSADNRVRLYFPGKPAQPIRERMKRAGFRWTPTMDCWQAYPNTNACAVARELAGAPVPAEEPPPMSDEAQKHAAAYLGAGPDDPTDEALADIFAHLDESCGDPAPAPALYPEIRAVIAAQRAADLVTGAAKLARHTASCGNPQCRGWHVNPERDRAERCDDCWHGDADPLVDEEAAAVRLDLISRGVMSREEI